MRRGREAGAVDWGAAMVVKAGHLNVAGGALCLLKALLE